MSRTRMAVRFTAVTCLLLSNGFASAAGTEQETSTWRVPDPAGLQDTRIEPSSTRGNLLRRALDDQRFLLRAWWPAEVRRWDFSAPLITATLIASQSSAGAGLDARLQRVIGDATGGGRGRDVAQGFTTLGDGRTALLLVGGTYLIARWSHAERLARTADRSAEALLNVAIYSVVLKQLTARTRPSPDHAGGFFTYRPEPGQSATSFPSGHTMTAFALAAVLSGEYPEKPWIRWLAYGMATLVAGSRVALGHHYPGDVLAGAALGRSLGRMVVYREHQTEFAPRRGWTLAPQVDPWNRGVGLTYRVTW